MVELTLEQIKDIIKALEELNSILADEYNERLSKKQITLLNHLHNEIE